MPSFLTGMLLLGLLVGFGVVAIVMIRSWWLRPGDGRGDWERTLTDCKNLRDSGVLSEEEYRKIRTLVEPRTRIGAPEPPVRQWPDEESSGTDNQRK